MKDLAAQCPKAVKIRLARDILNTRNTSSLYETFTAEEAFALSQRFEFYYTPRRASWMNMIEIEFSAITRQCLNRRIVMKAELEREVSAVVKEREKKARTKLNRHYERVNAENAQYKQA